MDRDTKTTLTRTIPRSIFKSYTKDLSLPIFEIILQYRLINILLLIEYRYNIMILDTGKPVPILTHYDIWKSYYISPLSSMDSSLEAFSFNPTHGSFSALTFQSTEFTNYVNQRFLSY